VATLTTLNFTTGANIVSFPERTSVANYGKIVFESSDTDLNLNRLYLYTGGEISNAGKIDIYDIFSWNGGTISGSGSTEVLSSATFSIQVTNHYLDEQMLVNSAIANWNLGSINFSNGAIFQNDNTFNANATTTMNGNSSGTFDNNGSFYKKTSDTTTTMDIDFSNAGEIEVIAGTLTFLSGITTGAGTSIDLGDGTLTAGDTLTLEAGASLVGSGILSSDLINGGEVSPGTSPGLITIEGDYTQTSGGILTIELGGTSAGTEHDQVVITGSAGLNGILDVSIYLDFEPSVGDSFIILSYASHTGTFITENLPLLPLGMEWQIEYGSNALTITAVSTSTFLFLPMVIR
jgi:hypothetical protein